MTSAVFASSVTYFIPIVALIWGIADGEKFKAGFVLWISLVIAGVLLVNTSKLSSKY
jgi:drug/metabolite transporter (DMT)-like permease